MLWHPLSIDHPQLLLVCGLSPYFSLRNMYVTRPCKYPHSRGKRAPEFFELYVIYSWQERPRLKKEVGEKRPNGACVTTMNTAQPFTVHRPAFGLPTHLPLEAKKRQEDPPLITEKGKSELRSDRGLAWTTQCVTE